LTAGLVETFGDGAAPGPVTVLDRSPNDPASTFPSEVVSCRLADGRGLQALCKYEAGRNHNALDHRGGVAYEDAVYWDVLGPVPVTAPRLYGTQTEGLTGDIWLVIEYVRQAAGADEAAADRLGLHSLEGVR
jgi:hypothetical protein